MIGVAVVVVLVPTGTISYLDSLRGKELNNNLNLAKEKFKKVQN